MGFWSEAASGRPVATGQNEIREQVTEASEVVPVRGDEPDDGEVLREIPGRENDPTLMRNQPALRRSQGRVWIVAGAIFSAVSLVVFLPAIPFQPALAWTGIGLVLGLFAAMLVVRFTVSSHRVRMLLLATLLLLIATAGLVCVILVSVSEWSPLL